MKKNTSTIRKILLAFSRIAFFFTSFTNIELWKILKHAEKKRSIRRK